MLKTIGILGSLVIGSVVLAGCGFNGQAITTPKGNTPSSSTHSSTASTPSSHSSSPSNSTAPSSSTSSSSTAAGTHSTTPTSSTTVNSQGLPTGEYLLKPGQLVPQAPGMMWSYRTMGNMTSVLSNQQVIMTMPFTASTVAAFNVSGTILLDLYPVGAHQSLQLHRQGTAWILQGQLANGRYRVEYGNLLPHSNTAPPTWGWARLGESEMITVTQGTIQSTPLKAPTVAGAVNPGFAIFNQNTNALIGFFSPTFNFSLNG